MRPQNENDAASSKLPVRIKGRCHVLLDFITEGAREQAEQLAKTESRTMSELFREAFRTYRAAAVRKRLVAGNAYAQGRAGHRYTEADVERLVDETRTELRTGNRKRR